MKTIEEVYDILLKYEDEKAQRTYAYIDKLKESGELDIGIESLDILETIKFELKKYLDLLFDKDGLYKNYPNKRALLLEKNETLRLLDSFGYILSSYCGNEKVYRDFPAYLKLLIDELKIEDYKYKLPEDIELELQKTVGLRVAYDNRYERVLKDINYKYAGHYINYDPIVEKIEKGEKTLVDSDDYWVWAEYSAYQLELRKMRLFGLKEELVEWVSRYDGDGYGYDILSIDPATLREKVIEVKAKRNEYKFLNITEYEYIKNMDIDSKVDYYMYAYRHNYKTHKTELTILLYKPDTGVFYNVYEPTEVYTVNDEGYDSTKRDKDFKFYLERVPKEDINKYNKRYSKKI